MTIHDQLHAHRSIRRFKPDPVPGELLERILAAAVAGTSSSGNMQPYSIIVTRDPALREALYPLHFHQEMVREAPVVVTFCSDFHRMRLWLEQRGAEDNFDNLMSFMIGAIDAVLVSQSVAIAAEAEGLGLCYMGTTLANCEAIARLLQLPEHVVPVVGFALGYPAEAPAARDRLPLDGLVHHEVYQDYSPAAIEAIYAERETTGWARYMASPSLRAAVERAGVYNLAQIYTTVKYTRESHLAYSRTVLACLARQGFMNHGVNDEAKFTPRITLDSGHGSMG